MAKCHDVLAYLYPQGGWTMTGFEYEGIEFGDCQPITKEQWEQAFIDYDNWKAEQAATKAAQRQALLTRLGITEDEARLLLG